MGDEISEIATNDWAAHRNDTFVGTLGNIVERRRNGLLEIGLHTEDRHRNLSGLVHGGIVMTLIDRTIGINCRAVGDGDPMATATLTVNFLRPIRVGDFLAVRCSLRKQGRKAIFADAEAFVGEKLVATATGMCMKVA